MNLRNIKDCSKCINSLVYGNKDNCTIKCTSSDYTTEELFNREGRYCASYCKCFKAGDKKRSGIIEQKHGLRFLMAGNSDFILHSTKTGDDFRFILSIQESINKNDSMIWYVNMIKASERIYCGIIYYDTNSKEFKYTQGEKGKIASTSVDIRSLLFIVNKLIDSNTVNNLEIYSLGKCGCCGKDFDILENMNTGIHTECDSNLYIDDLIHKHNIENDIT